MTLSSMTHVESIRPMRSKSPKAGRRYSQVADSKESGAIYTPRGLADFVARQIVNSANFSQIAGRLRVLEPALGDGELLLSLLRQLPARLRDSAEVYGFETESTALDRARERVLGEFPGIQCSFHRGSFLDYILKEFGAAAGLFVTPSGELFDLVIANPPYVRTQIMGANQAQSLAQDFGLTGRVDLYHAFLLGIGKVLRPGGTAGVIVSNRFMSTRAGAQVRQVLRQALEIVHVWDLGDTKLFDAAILPAVLLVRGKAGESHAAPQFTSIYETGKLATARCDDPLTAIECNGTVETNDGRRFEVRHGRLDIRGKIDGVWRIATDRSDSWLATVQQNMWGTFRDVGKIRVGVKTCADSVFIRDDWDEMGNAARPELLRNLITHHVAQRFKARKVVKPRQILYPHTIADGARVASDLSKYPHTAAYLELHRQALEGRRYVIDGGRKWYEIWVPQDPVAWEASKLVFRDISEEPTFWIDQDGSVVNGDCYWLKADRRGDERLLWLAAAVGNSSFATAFYDHRFVNKLYAGRRRFMTQYVEQFPLPDPDGDIGKELMSKTKLIFELTGTKDVSCLRADLDQLVWKAFGLDVEEIGG
jgi:adenine-specific DNA-methyltransferase